MHPILQQSHSLIHTMTQLRHTLHSYAEVGFELPKTCALVKEHLAKLGISAAPCGQSGLTAILHGREPGKTFLLRADMDALPITEESGVSYAGTNGSMHACGHDMHTAMLLGAAELLMTNRDRLKGSVKLMFQPAEERLEGAKSMIDAGVLDKPKVDAALMVHVLSGVPLKTGTVLVSAPGINAPSADFFHIKLTGKGCHGSDPSAGIDPLLPAAQLLMSLSALTSKELGLSNDAVLTVGHLTGTSAANVIPEAVTLHGTLRTTNEETRTYLHRRIYHIAEGIALASRVKAKFVIDSSCPTLISDASLSEAAYRHLSEMLPKDLLYRTSDPAFSDGSKAIGRGSEDFSYVSHRVPSLMLALSAGAPSNEGGYPLHHPRVHFEDAALSYGAAAMAQVAMRWLESQ